MNAVDGGLDVRSREDAVITRPDLKYRREIHPSKWLVHGR
jgi:hypothetical protein